MTFELNPATVRYIRRVNALPALGREEELRLAHAHRANGDRQAAQRVISANLRHVVPLALRYRRYGVPVSELIGEGNLGLLRALGSFEPERELRFATYANYWVRAEILRCVLEQRSLVGGGRGELRPKYFFRLRREHARLSASLGDEGAVQGALAARWQLSRDALSSILARLEHADAALDAPGARSLGETLRDREEDQELTVDRQRVRARLADAVEVARAALDPREQVILERRLLADPEEEISLAQLGAAFGVSRERARQLEARVKSKLRRQLELLLGASCAELRASAA